MKSTIIAGDTLDFLVTSADYPPGDGWTLKFRLTPRTSGTPIDITAAVVGTDYHVLVIPATTVAYVPGEYSWASWVEKTGARYSIDSGIVTIKSDPAARTVYDDRSHARKTLDAIEAVIENRATLDQEEYTIGGRSLRRTSLADLMRMRNQYVALVKNEVAVENIANGIGVGSKIQVRF